jgi:hypothetical protein
VTSTGTDGSPATGGSSSESTAVGGAVAGTVGVTAGSGVASGVPEGLQAVSISAATSTIPNLFHITRFIILLLYIRRYYTTYGTPISDHPFTVQYCDVNLP